jgi:hypothetical protein
MSPLTPSSKLFFDVTQTMLHRGGDLASLAANMELRWG